MSFLPPAPEGPLPLAPRDARRAWLTGTAMALAGALRPAHAGSSSVVATPLRVVMDARAAPICFVDAGGQPRGLAVELLQHLAQQAQLPIEVIVPMPRADALEAFRRRGAEVLLDGVRTEERARSALFTRPYQALTSVLVSRLMGRHYQTLESCRGARLALVAGHEWTETLRRRHAQVALLSVPSHEAVLDAVAAGRADVGLAANEFVLRPLHTAHAGRLAITALVPEVSTELSLMLQPELLALRDVLDHGLAAVSEQWLAAARERWFGIAEGQADGGILTWSQMLHEASPLLLAAGGAAVGSMVWIQRLRREVQRRREAEREIAASRDAAAEAAAHRKRFIAFLSHEARSLVAGISGGLDLLANAPDERLQQRLVDGLRANAAGLRQLLDESLDAAAIDAGAVSVKLRAVRLRCLLAALRDETSVLASARRLNLELPADAGGTLQVMADPVRLAQALRNLVVNALKFTDRGGVRIAVRTVVADGQARVRIDVVDSGRGMSADELARLFKPFGQLGDAAANPVHPGSGLGLAISHELVRRMGGTLHVSSVPGQGSCFSIELPAPHDEPAAYIAPLQPALSAP